jgi:5'-deoxynucleotidase YfbR-like HD superfamily hydrolase
MLHRKQLNFVYNGGVSKRFHTCPTLTEQNIAEHSFGVAWLCELLTDKKASKALIMAALSHDLAEWQVGDVPAPTKRQLQLTERLHEFEMNHLKVVEMYYEDELDDNEKRILKLADYLDGMNFCLRELSFGNSNLASVFWKFYAYCSNVTNTDRENAFVESIRIEWEKRNGKSE